jgi:hypothetical protein
VIVTRWGTSEWKGNSDQNISLGVGQNNVAENDEAIHSDTIFWYRDVIDDVTRYLQCRCSRSCIRTTTGGSLDQNKLNCICIDFNIFVSKYRFFFHRFVLKSWSMYSLHGNIFQEISFTTKICDWHLFHKDSENETCRGNEDLGSSPLRTFGTLLGFIFNLPLWVNRARR